MKRLLIIPLLCLLAITAGAQNVQVKAEWHADQKPGSTKASIVLGEQLDLMISVTADKIPTVSFPTSDDLGVNDLVVVSQHIDTLDNTQNGKGFTLSQYSTMTCFEVGAHSTGLLSVQVAQNGNMTPVVCPDSLILTVNDVAGVDTSKAEIKDIANILREPYTFWEIFRWVLLALVVAGAAFLIVHLMRRRGTIPAQTILPPTPPTPPDQQALDQLEQLRTKEMWQRGQIKAYHTELTDILRRYLRTQFGIDSTEMTSGQTIDAFQDCTHRNDESLARLRRILRTADMVKFAKAEPQPYEHDQSMTDAKEFVNETRSKKGDA